jgi:hypothetical protein
VEFLALRNDAFEPHLAGMGEDGRAVALDMLVEPDAGAGLGQDGRERCLADLERVAAQVVTVQLDEVEGVEEHAVVSTVVFCPTCGSTVYWEGEGFPGYVAVAIGNFADPSFPAPTIAVWEESRHPWVSLPPDTPPKRVAKQG